MSWLQRIFGVNQAPPKLVIPDDTELKKAFDVARTRNQLSSLNLKSSALSQITDAQLVRLTVGAVLSRLDERTKKDAGHS